MSSSELGSRIGHLHGPEEVPYGPEELLVVCLVRNGRPYLRSFLEHYLGKLGAKHVVFLDNASTDGTPQAASAHRGVTVLETELPFRDYEITLRRYLIERFGRGRWVLCVDADELFDYPYSGVVGLGAFLGYLTERSYTAVVAQMLDMFPGEPVRHAGGTEGDEPLKERHRFYDVTNVREREYRFAGGTNNTVSSDQIAIYRLGVQHTLFGQPASLTKHPLVFVDGRIRPMDDSVHWVSGARVADVSCVLLHYKFIGDLYERALLSVREENFPKGSLKYKRYLRKLGEGPELAIRGEGARELRGVDELVDNQFLVVSEGYMALAEEEGRRVGRPGLAAGAFARASARARSEAARARELELRVEALEGSAAGPKRRRVPGDPGDRERNLAARRANLEARERRLEARKRNLEAKNRDLEDQIRAIQASRSWRVLTALGRAKGALLRQDRGV